LDSRGALLLFEDRIVAKTFTLRLFAVIACWMRFVALGAAKWIRKPHAKSRKFVK
jgi:hypothetical protein